MRALRKLQKGQLAAEIESDESSSEEELVVQKQNAFAMVFY